MPSSSILFLFFSILLLLTTTILHPSFVSCYLLPDSSSANTIPRSQRRNRLPSPITTKLLLLLRETSSDHFLQKPKVSEYISPELSCKFPKICSHFSNTLLVIKLNPVRLLWIDNLLKFYSLGFENIVFYAPREKDQSTTTSPDYDEKVLNEKARVVEFLRVGVR